MAASIDHLLQELYALDPTLREHDRAVREIIERLLATKPTFTLNEQFATQLRQTIMQQEQPASTSKKYGWWSLLLVPIATAVLIIVYPSLKSTPPSSISANGTVITQSGHQAFGDLTLGNFSSTRNSTTTPTVGKAESTDTSSGSGSSSGALIAPTPDGSYQFPIFSYTGALTIPRVDVLQRVKSITGLSANSALSLVDLSTFGQLTTDQVTWSQNTSDGYTIMVDGREGMMSIFRPGNAVTSEPASGSVSRTETLRGNTNVAPTISETDAITIANAFLSAHGISQSGYGDPTVQTSLYATPLLKTTGAENLIATAAPAVTVTYPLIVNDLTVYDESGAPYGLQVTVEAATRSVQSVYNIISRTFRASSYDLATDVQTIRDYLLRGGWLWSTLDTKLTTVTITPSAPTTVYMLSRYQLANTQDELLVPALRFPLAAADQAKTGRTAVVVPVIKQLLTQSSTRTTTVAPTTVPSVELSAPTNQ